MSYPRNRTDDPRIGRNRLERRRIRQERRRKVLQAVKCVGRWLWTYWWVILIWALVLLFILVGCPWIRARAEAQAEVRYLSDAQWRTAIVDGFHMLPGHDLPEVADVPDWEKHYEPVVVPDMTAKTLAYLDVWCEKNPL